MSDRGTENKAFRNLRSGEYAKNIETRLDTDFPLIGPSKLAAFRDGGIQTGSVDMTSPQANEVLAVMFARASDREDKLASSHARKHKSEAVMALSTLADAAEKGKLITKKFPFTQEGERPVARYEFTTEKQYKASVPEAFLEAAQISVRPQETYIGELRQLAQESGHDVALLAAAYLNLPERDVFGNGGVFDRQVFKDLVHKVTESKLPIATRPEDTKLYSRLKRVIHQDENPHRLKKLNPSLRAFDIVREDLVRWGADRANLQIVRVKVTGKAIAVVPTLMARAYQVADPRFTDPDLTTAVYGLAEHRIATTIITAYRIMDYPNAKPLNRLGF